MRVRNFEDLQDKSDIFAFAIFAVILGYATAMLVAAAEDSYSDNKQRPIPNFTAIILLIATVMLATNQLVFRTIPAAWRACSTSELEPLLGEEAAKALTPARPIKEMGRLVITTTAALLLTRQASLHGQPAYDDYTLVSVFALIALGLTQPLSTRLMARLEFICCSNAAIRTRIFHAAQLGITPSGIDHDVLTGSDRRDVSARLITNRLMSFNALVQQIEGGILTGEVIRMHNTAYTIGETDMIEELLASFRRLYNHGEGQLAYNAEEIETISRLSGLNQILSLKASALRDYCQKITDMIPCLLNPEICNMSNHEPTIEPGLDQAIRQALIEAATNTPHQLSDITLPRHLPTAHYTVLSNLITRKFAEWFRETVQNGSIVSEDILTPQENEDPSITSLRDHITSLATVAPDHLQDVNHLIFPDRISTRNIEDFADDLMAYQNAGEMPTKHAAKVMYPQKNENIQITRMGVLLT